MYQDSLSTRVTEAYDFPLLEIMAKQSTCKSPWGSAAPGTQSSVISGSQASARAPSPYIRSASQHLHISCFLSLSHLLSWSAEAGANRGLQMRPLIWGQELTVHFSRLSAQKPTLLSLVEPLHSCGCTTQHREDVSTLWCSHDSVLLWYAAHTVWKNQ